MENNLKEILSRTEEEILKGLGPYYKPDCSFPGIHWNLRNGINKVKPLVLKDLRILDLSYLEIRKIPKEISKLEFLEVLDISNNQITDINPICGLKNLKMLSLARNNIQILPKEVQNLKNLEYLDLNNNILESLDSICGLKSLEVLDLTNFCRDSITVSLPKKIGDLVNLKKLYIGQNRIRKLPLEMSNLRELEVLHAYIMELDNDCGLDDILPKLRKLTVLALDDNRFKEVGIGIFHLKQLKYLGMENNEITRIPEEISQLKNLQRINLSCNQIKSIPNSFKELKQLESVEIMKNKISDISNLYPFAGLNQLKYIALFGNPIVCDGNNLNDKKIDEVSKQFEEINPNCVLNTDDVIY